VKCDTCHGEIPETAEVCPQCGGRVAADSGRFAAADPLPAHQRKCQVPDQAGPEHRSRNFKLAIEKYQQAMRLIGEKKELAQTKQELFQTMTSLALTYFTIQENAKSTKQLEDLIQINPNHELDPEFYPPKFVEIFRTVQRNFLGRLVVDSVPAGAEVTVNGKKSGRTPLALERVLKGKYSLKLERVG
jgi:hypothetical protein